MQIGWIDFSRTERNKVLDVLSMLSEAGTLDELGIAPVRDAFSNLFFPGTSTIQTRAKYFLCVPYAFKDVERSGENSRSEFIKQLSKIEKYCGEYFIATTPNADGIIGKRSLGRGQWVRRPPSEIYWAGLKRLGIFRNDKLSISEYISQIFPSNTEKETLKRSGNRNDNAEENEADDNDAGKALYFRSWNIPTYTTDWKNNLTLELTAAESAFLKHQIIETCKDTMLEYILSNNLKEICEVESFTALSGGIINSFPEQIQRDYYLALSFSEFVYALRVVYNIIVSEEQNESANYEWSLLEAELSQIAMIDIDEIFSRLALVGQAELKMFLKQSQEYMLGGNIEWLKGCIVKREVWLKGENRSKTKNPKAYDNNDWFGGGRLDYRFRDAKNIIKDIFEGENNAES